MSFRDTGEFRGSGDCKRNEGPDFEEPFRLTTYCMANSSAYLVDFASI